MASPETDFPSTVQTRDSKRLTMPQLLLTCIIEMGCSALSTEELDNPAHEVAFQWISGLNLDQLREEFPFIPLDRCESLRSFAHIHALRIGSSRPPSAAPPAPPPPATAGRVPFRNPLEKVGWSYNGRSCTALATEGTISVHYWLEQLSGELEGQGVQDEVTKGQCMRQLLTEPLRGKLLAKVRELPELESAIKAGTATLSHHYADALVSCAGWSGDLSSHQEATHPARRNAESLQAATARAEHNWRAAAALGCCPSTAGCFWALFGLLTVAERALFTGRPGVNERMLRPFQEPAEAANRRYTALLDDLLKWARLQPSSDRDLHPPRPPPSPAPPSPSGGSPQQHSRSTSQPPRRGASPHPGRRPSAVAAPAVVTTAPVMDAPDSDEDASPTAQATVAHAAPFRAFNYTGNRGADEEETRRRMREHLCLYCWVSAGQGINGRPYPRDSCPHHQQRLGAPGCRPYPAS